MPAAALLLCLVVGVSDGDTITVRCGEADQQKVRLSQIDAPEKAMAYGQRSKQALSDLIYKRTVELHPAKKDRYGRTVADVLVDGQSVQWKMVADGWAHCYVQYVTDQACYGYQDAARAAKRGLWADPDPVQPWEWRKAKRAAKK